MAIKTSRGRVLLLLGLLLLVAQPSRADDIVTSWASVKLPPPPSLRTVKLDPAHTALLLLDFDMKICNSEKRPRCAATLPALSAMLKDARARGVTIAYSITGASSIVDEPPSLAPRSGDPVVQAGVDKFLGTALEATLKAKGVQTVVVTGTSAHGAALYTASAAALRGFNVVVPVDGMSADDPFAELAAAWVLANAPVSVSSHVTLTRSSLIGY